MSEYNTSDLIMHAAEGKALEFGTVFESILQSKLQEAVENKKTEMADNFFNEDWRERLSALAAHNTNLPITRKEAEERQDQHQQAAKKSTGVDRVTHQGLADEFGHVLTTMDRNEGKKVDFIKKIHTPESVNTLMKASDKRLNTNDTQQQTEEENLEPDWEAVEPYLNYPPKPKKKPKLNITKPKEDYYPPAP